MSIRTNKPSNVIDREYGRRMYVSKKPYSEQIRIPTDKNQDDQIDKKHSEFKKPYLSDTYEEMEYFADAPIGYAFMPGSSGNSGTGTAGSVFGSGNVTIDTPWMGTPVPDFGKGGFGIPSPDSCYCSLLCWEEASEKCMSCNREIIFAQFLDKHPGFSLSYSKRKLCIAADTGATKEPLLVKIDMRYLQPGYTDRFIGCSEEILVYQCKGGGVCFPDESMAWDDANSDDTVARSGTATITITADGGTPQNAAWTWNVSGTGFWFDAEYTSTEIFNTTYTSVLLYADGSACGSATITVTGCDNTVVTGYVRCTTGTWAFKSYTCGLIGPFTSYYKIFGSDYRLMKTSGNQYQEHDIHTYAYCDPAECSVGSCGPYEADGECLMTGNTILPNWFWCNACIPAEKTCVRNLLIEAGHSVRYYEWECS